MCGCARSAGPQVADGEVHVLVDQVGVDGDGGGGSLAGGGDDLGARVRRRCRPPRRPGTVVRPVASATTQPSSSTAQPRPTSRSLFGTKRGRTNTASARTTSTVLELDTGQPVVLDDQPGHRAVDDADRAGHQLLALVGRQRVRCGGRTRRRTTTAGPAGRAGRRPVCRRARRAAGRGPRGRGSTGSAAGRGPSARGRPGGRGARRAARWRPGGAARAGSGRRRAGPRSRRRRRTIA